MRCDRRDHPGRRDQFRQPVGLDRAALARAWRPAALATGRAQVSAAGNTDRADWFIAGSAFHQDGFRRHARQDTQRISGNPGIALTDAVETRFFINAVKTDSECPVADTR